MTRESILAANVENQDEEWLNRAVGVVRGGLEEGEYFPFSDDEAVLTLLNAGVEEFGTVSIAADMEEWAEGGLYVVGFMDSPQCWFAPFGLAVCRAYLLAWQVRQKETTSENT